MEEKVVDRRVRKTKRQLRLALMKLMAEKSVKDISVRELAAIADINRGTFYIHYKDVYDLTRPCAPASNPRAPKPWPALRGSPAKRRAPSR